MVVIETSCNANEAQILCSFYNGYYHMLVEESGKFTGNFDVVFGLFEDCMNSGILCTYDILLALDVHLCSQKAG